MPLGPCIYSALRCRYRDGKGVNAPAPATPPTNPATPATWKEPTPMSNTPDTYTADGPTCGCCGNTTIPPTPGTDEEGFYCEPCGTAWVDPTQVVGPCWIHGGERA